MSQRHNDEQKLLETSVKRFAERDIAPHLEEWEHSPDHRLPEAVVSGLGELGLLDLAASDSFSGDGIALLTVALRTLSFTAAAPATLLFAHALARRLLQEAAAESGTTPSLPAELSAYPIYAEPGDPELRCREERDVLVVDGCCQLVVGAPIASTLVLPATCGDGVVLLALDRDTPRLEIGSPLLTLGMRGCPTADVTLSGARIPRDRRIASDAIALIGRAHALFRAPAVAIAAGVLARSVRTATAYAEKRYQGGRNIIDHQQVRSMLAGMLADEALCDCAVERLLDGTAEPAANELFLRAKERAAHAVCDGVQVLGGYGYMEDYGQERCMRDAKQAQCLLGRCEVLRQDAMERWVAEVAEP